MRRVLLATFGSGGDLAPLIGVAEQLTRQRHDVAFVVPRSLGMYLRAAGSHLPAFGIGDGSELQFMRDRALFTTRFSGWASHRRTFVQYIAPTLRHEVAEVQAVIRRWSPDVVVTTTYAVAARIAALVDGVSHVPCSIYPQYFALGQRRNREFARPYVQAVREACPRAVVDDYGLRLVAWGADETTVLLHDPWLLSADHLPGGLDVIGYPYYDALASDENAEERALAWLERPEPTILVTLGSFVPLSETAPWRSAAAAVRSCGARALLVNTRPGMFEAEHRDDSTLAVGYVRLSRVAHRATAIVHHGGLGTTIATLRAGRPAVVMPQAFDQPLNAGVVANVGAGIASSSVALERDLSTLLVSPTLLAGARFAGRQLIPGENAAARAAEIIVARCSR